jgi:hypothetical protein
VTETAEKEFMMRLHGDFGHRLAIYVIKDILMYKDAKLKVKLRDERQFKSLYHSPCEPDVYFECVQSHMKGNKKQKLKELHVIEVETKPTLQSTGKKLQQYEEALAGVRLTVINLGEIIDQFYGGTYTDHLPMGSILWDFRDMLELRLPI